MGTFVVGAILVIVVCLIVRSMIHDKRTENPCSAAAIVKTAEDIVLKWNRTEDI